LEVASDWRGGDYRSNGTQVDHIALSFAVIDDEIGLRRAIGGFCAEDE
jgi:hypothetical protein